MSERRIVTISYTDVDAGGGVPAFNRAIHTTFTDRECIHFCWESFPWLVPLHTSEWDRARMLNEYLVKSKQVGTDDVVIADGFWAAGLEHLPFAISHSHGIWSHLTADDVAAGKKPDMPGHHFAQVNFRRNWTNRRKPFTAVSHFIAEQMRLQWGFQVDRVINNGVWADTPEQYDRCIADRTSLAPLRVEEKLPIRKPFTILHGVNDPSNKNKGYDHILLLEERFPEFHIMSLDKIIDELTSGESAFPNRANRRRLPRC